MFLALAIILAVIWVILFFAIHITAALIHLLLIFAVISLIIHFIAGRRA